MFLLGQQGIFPVDMAFRMIGPVILIALGLFSILSHGHPSRVFWGAFILLLGFVLLVNNLGIAHIRFEALWPLWIIGAGVWMLLRTTGGLPPRNRPYRNRGGGFGPPGLPGAPPVQGPPPPPSTPPQPSGEPPLYGQPPAQPSSPAPDPPHSYQAPYGAPYGSPQGHQPPPGRAGFAEDGNSGGADPWANWWGSNHVESMESEFDYSSIFGHIGRRIISKNFRGGKIAAVFGGFELDLTQAEIEGSQAVLHADTVFGGGEIRVPDTWEVTVKGAGVFGGYSNETRQHPPENPANVKRLIIRGAAVFGGVVVKN
jgi:Cell wall-active antibiotics response 4TMS YvqF